MHSYPIRLLLLAQLFMLGVSVFTGTTTYAASAAVLTGQRLSLSATAAGTPPFTYQWYKDGSILSGSVGSVYAISNFQASSAGSYNVIISNSLGSTTSDNAILTVGVAVAITAQPIGKALTTGSSITFSVSATGTPSPTLQWQKNGVNIAGATSTTYSITNAKITDTAAYSVVVSNGISSATSVAASLTVVSIPAGFDVQGYFARNLDIASSYPNDPAGAWLHFLNYGLNEGRSFDAQFIVDEYLELNPDIKTVFGTDRQGALLHWLNYGRPLEDRMGRVPIGFNVDNYLVRYPDINLAFGGITPRAKRNVTVWNHYLDYGVREGRSDGDFEAYNYLATNADLAAIFGSSVEDAAMHWYFYGRREGRRIPSNFNVNGYRSRNPDVVVVWGNDLYGSWLHYRDVGVYENRTYDDLFRVLEYRARYPDVQASYGNNLTGVLLHWLFFGKPEGRLGRNP